MTNEKGTPVREGEVYRDGRYVLGFSDGTPYLVAGARRFTLSSHPFEPCLYITDERGIKTAVHNAFVPEYALDSFRGGKTVSSITGREYGPEDFCRMAEYAAGMTDIAIDDAERVFGGSPKKKERTESAPEEIFCPDDPFYGVMASYPDSEVDFCIVKDGLPYQGYGSHWRALALASRRIFTKNGENTLWRGYPGRAEGRKAAPDALFAADDGTGELSYRRAFLDPPHGNGYGDSDFDLINSVLFPNGTDGLEIYKWSSDWSDYFDEGHEWWGALCLTVYDRSLDRFAVIMASSTD